MSERSFSRPVAAQEGEWTLAAELRHGSSWDAPSAASRLIARAKQGDTEAFRELVVEQERRVLRTTLRLLGNAEDAKDAAQEVFVRLYRYLARLDERRPIEPWLYRMTVNVCRDFARRQRRNAEVLRRAATRAPTLSTGHRPDLEEQKRVVEEGLRRLSERERSALTLRDLEGLPTKEVAEIMKVSEGTVRSLISRARVKLKRFRDRTLEKDYGL